MERRAQQRETGPALALVKLVPAWPLARQARLGMADDAVAATVAHVVFVGAKLTREEVILVVRELSCPLLPLCIAIGKPLGLRHGSLDRLRRLDRGLCGVNRTGRNFVACLWHWNSGGLSSGSLFDCAPFRRPATHAWRR